MFGALAGLALGTAAKAGMDYLKGSISNKHYADRIRDQADLQYRYAQMYTQNSPSWTIKGLREAGLNPILAVSNGVNLGANVPNLTASNPDTDSGSAPDISGVMQRSQELSINKANADSNTVNADAHMIQAKAAADKAAADVENKRADTALKIIDAERRKGSNYDSNVMRDAEKLLNNLSDNFKEFESTSVPIDTYLQNRPVSSTTNARDIAKQRDIKEQIKRDSTSGAHSKYINPYYKTRKTIDGSPVYRKRGDVGGVMHIYR